MQGGMFVQFTQDLLLQTLFVLTALLFAMKKTE